MDSLPVLVKESLFIHKTAVPNLLSPSASHSRLVFIYQSTSQTPESQQMSTRVLGRVDLGHPVCGSSLFGIYTL